MSVKRTITIEGIAFNELKDIKSTHDLAYTAKQIIDKWNLNHNDDIEETDYIYARPCKGNYERYMTSGRGNRLLILKMIVDNKLSVSLDGYIDYVAAKKADPALFYKQKKDEFLAIIDHFYSNGKEKITKKKNGYTLYLKESDFSKIERKIDNLPKEITFEDKMEITDDEGNVYSPRMYGERTKEGILFDIDDIDEMCGNGNLANILIQGNSKYTKNKHYIQYMIKLSDMNNVHSSKKNTLSKNYLTYDGFMKVIHDSRNTNVDKFKSWANRIVYTHHLGTDEQKEELIEEIIDGMSRKEVKRFSNYIDNPVNCIYAFIIGKAGNLKDKYPELTNEDPDKYLIKLGKTNDINRRFGEHQKTYGKQIKLIRFSYIPDDTLTKAENKLLEVASASKVDIAHHKELYLFKDYTKVIKTMFELINETHAKSLSLLNNKIEQLINENDRLKKFYEGEIAHMKEVHAVKMESKNKDLVLKDKDIELLIMKIKLLEAGINH